MSGSGTRISFFGSSLVSAYWNGAATYYRGILRALSDLGYRITFYEPDAYGRQEHRDIPDPEWARVVVYPGDRQEALNECLRAAEQSEIVVKASGVGVFDEYLEHRVSGLHRSVFKIFWDVDAPATLERMDANVDDAFRRHLAGFDLVFTYGGGQRVVDTYNRFGAMHCVPIYNALDPDIHRPEPADASFEADLSFLGNRLPDRELRVDEFFFRAAEQSPKRQFTIGGSGWDDKSMPVNVRNVGHVYTAQHNRFNCSSTAVLNVCRESMARFGYSPATRVFEAAGAGACLISDEWEGIEEFLWPGEEVLVAANGIDVATSLQRLTKERARTIGRQARERALRDHTYSQRALLVDASIRQSGRAKNSATAAGAAACEFL